jgi:hypothetical protein
MMPPILPMFSIADFSLGRFFMSNERSVRFLATLGGASTSRVLNLAQVAQANRDNPEYAEQPLFNSPIINTAFIMKHRMRKDEAFLFDSGRTMVTKIISPFDHDDLRAGGRSILVDQRGFDEAIKEFGNYNGKALDRDLKVLKLLNALPSLDPFLLREYLANNKITVAPCYFAISDGDQQRMRKFVTTELARLTKLLGADASEASTERMVAALLSSDVAEELAPLRETLNLSGEDFRQGVFSWRGFLYYKWSMARFWPDVMGVLRQIKEIQPHGAVSQKDHHELDAARNGIITRVRDNGQDVSRILSVYDTSFSNMVAQQAPKTFRDFLLSAPYTFAEMGEKMGAISHMVGFWGYRFPAGKPVVVDAEELGIIFQDFNSGFAEKMAQGESPLIRRPAVLDRTA